MSEITKYSDEEVEIRAAKKEDMKAVAEMIQELADFEEMPNGPKLSIKELEHDGFELNPPAFKCKVAELKLGGTPQLVGYSLYFPIYSTWEGRTMMLEDLYVKSSERRHGLGNRLFDAVAREASSAGCARLDFHVLESNPARIFYDGKGAINITDSEKWCCYRLSGEALHKLSSKDKA